MQRKAISTLKRCSESARLSNGLKQLVEEVRLARASQSLPRMGPGVPKNW